MKLTRKKLLYAILLLVGLAAVILIPLAWRFSQQVNITPMRGEGSVADVTVPDGFEVTVFATGLQGPRFMTVAPDGTLTVAERLADRIVRLPDADGDGVADELVVMADEIPRPHSVVYHQDAWFVGVTSGIIRLEDAAGTGVINGRSQIIDDYPTSGSHSTRTVEFLPDGRMVVSIGSSCNVCDEEDPRRAGIVIYDSAQAENERLLATGLRNAVGLAIQPGTGLLWASNNGRDLMGDDTPPETIYQVVDGGDYGWPRCHSGRIIDPDMGQPGDCEGVLAPVVEMQAHSAPLGLTFYDADLFPAEYQGDLFIAFHGSWNRSEPTGYKVVRLDFENGEPVANEVVDFAVGWLDQETDEAAGRPVDVVVGADGALYVSDDKGGIIYRIAPVN